MTDGPVPLFDPRGQVGRLRAEIDARVARVLDHGQYILGPEVGEFEERLADRAGVAHAVTLGNGTDALTLALLAEGIGPGDAVFVPSFTFVATAGAVVAAGARPVFCDVDPASFNLDAEDLARRAARPPDGLRPRAVIPVDLFGQPADYAAIGDVASAHGLSVLADAAQSFGGAREGAPVGSLARVSATSFYPTKPLGGVGDGGALLTADAELARRLRAIRVHGGGEIAGQNSRLDTLQAAVLLAKLATFEADLERRAAVAARYDAAFAGLVGRQICPPGTLTAHAVYAVLVARRDAVQAALTDRGIAHRAYYATPLHLMPAMRPFSEGAGSLPVTERLSAEILALPLHAELSDEQAARVIEAVVAAVGQPAGASVAAGR